METQHPDTHKYIIIKTSNITLISRTSSKWDSTRYYHMEGCVRCDQVAKRPKYHYYVLLGDRNVIIMVHNSGISTLCVTEVYVLTMTLCVYHTDQCVLGGQYLHKSYIVPFRNLLVPCWHLSGGRHLCPIMEGRRGIVPPRTGILPRTPVTVLYHLGDIMVILWCKWVIFTCQTLMSIYVNM